MGGERGTGREPVLELRLHLPVGSRELELELTTESLSVAVFGPSGGGKSTLLRTVAGVERRGRGLVRVRGQSWLDSQEGRFLPPWERGVGWVPQDYLLFPHLDVRQNLGFAGASSEAIEEVSRLLLVHYLLDRRPRRLSGGEQQRVALGRALLARPRILLLDEPFSALDRPLRNRVAAAVRDFVREREIPLILVSHDEADAVALAQEHWLLSESRLVRVE